MKYTGILLLFFCVLLALELYTTQSLQYKVDELQHKLDEKRNEIIILTKELNTTKAELKMLHENYYILKKHPTYDEVKNFTYSSFIIAPDYYKCYHYMFMKWREAVEAGIFASPVIIYYPHAGHAVLAFNTSDRRIVYYDPSVGRFVNITVGKSYSAENGLHGWFDDRVLDYADFWDLYPKEVTT